MRSGNLRSGKAKDFNGNKSWINYLISVVIHLIIICLFFPSWEKLLPVFNEPTDHFRQNISTVEVATTSFSASKESSKLLAVQDDAGEIAALQNQLTIEQPVENAVSVESYAPSPLPDIKQKKYNSPEEFGIPDKLTASSANDLSRPDESKTEVKIIAANELSGIPRQIVEALPEMTEGSVKGTINLSLKIGLDGKVKEYKVIKNTSNSAECLKRVIEAIQRSRWEKVTYHGSQVEYWIDKSYIFN